jgi:selT/selW/selH-like putative selenoprotein
MSSSQNPQILIEICHNCKAHQWCTRHNEKAYENISVEVSKTIKDKIPNANIQVVKVEKDKIGSFEVFCNNYEIFSKRTLGYFPHAEAVTQRIIDYLDGKF